MAVHRVKKKDCQRGILQRGAGLSQALRLGLRENIGSSYRLRAGGILATMGSKKKGSKSGGLSNPSPIAESLPSHAQLQENQLGAFRPVTPACYPRRHAFPPPTLTTNSLFTALSRTTLRPPRLSSPSQEWLFAGLERRKHQEIPALHCPFPIRSLRPANNGLVCSDPDD